MVLLPKHRLPTSPGRLLQRFLEDHELTQSRLAELTDMQLQRINQIVKGKRTLTSDTALRLARFFGTTPDLWVNAQTAWDLWHAREESGAEIEEKVTPLAEVAKAQRGGESAPAAARPAGRGGGGASYEPVIASRQAARAPRGIRYARTASRRRARVPASRSATRTHSTRSRRSKKKTS